MWAFGGENGGFKLEPADKSGVEMFGNLTARMLQSRSIVVWQSDVEMVWRSLKLNPSGLANPIPRLLSGKAALKNARRATGTVPNVYLCSCKQQNSPLESVVWTRRKLSDLIIGQTHLLPVKTISCSSRSARAPVQISEAANRFLPAASVGFKTASVETSRGSEDTGSATDRPGLKPAFWSPRRWRCAQQSTICWWSNVFWSEHLLHLSGVRGQGSLRTHVEAESPFVSFVGVLLFPIALEHVSISVSSPVLCWLMLASKLSCSDHLNKLLFKKH